MEVPLSLETDSRSRRCWRRRSSQFSVVQKRNNYTQLISSPPQSINLMTCVVSERVEGGWVARPSNVTRTHSRKRKIGRNNWSRLSDKRERESRGERRCCGVWSAAEAESADWPILGPHSDNNRPVIEANMRVMAGALEWTTIITLRVPEGTAVPSCWLRLLSNCSKIKTIRLLTNSNRKNVSAVSE